MKKNSPFFTWSSLIIFLVGALVSYLLAQIKFFEVELKINVPEFIVSVTTAAIAIYIAQTIQKNLTKNQNQYTYLGSKLDVLWNSFNTFSQSLEYTDQIPLQTVTAFAKDSDSSLSFLKNVFSAYEFPTDSVIDLENKIDTFVDFLETLPIQNNIVSLLSQKALIDTYTSEIDRCFSNLLKIVHDI